MGLEEGSTMYQVQCTKYQVQCAMWQDARDKKQESRQNFGSGKGDFGRWISESNIRLYISHFIKIQLLEI